MQKGSSCLQIRKTARCPFPEANWDQKLKDLEKAAGLRLHTVQKPGVPSEEEKKNILTLPAVIPEIWERTLFNNSVGEEVHLYVS